jgi:hypothetical protein
MDNAKSHIRNLFYQKNSNYFKVYHSTFYLGLITFSKDWEVYLILFWFFPWYYFNRQAISRLFANSPNMPPNGIKFDTKLLNT